MGATMVDHGGFRSSHPEFCNPGRLRGLGPEPRSPPAGAIGVKGWEQILPLITLPPPPPETPSFKPAPRGGPAGPSLKDILGMGNEGLALYHSFRLDPGAWGVYLNRQGLEVLTGELQRIMIRGFPEARQASPERLGEMAFRLAYDYALGHAKFHAAVDDFAAEAEAGAGRELYGPYLQGPYVRTLRSPPPNFNLEEALANVVALRTFLNPSAMIELGSSVEKSLPEDHAFRWNSYIMSGLVGAELIFLLRILPPGYRDFLPFLGKRTEVTAYAHMSIQYNLNQEEFNRGLRALASLVLGREATEGEAQGLLRVVPTPQYLY